MELREHLAVLRRRWLWVAAVTLLGVLLPGVATFMAKPVYTASASVYFSLRWGTTATDLAQGATFTQEQMTSYASLATTPTVLSPVIRDLGLHETVQALAGQVSATSPDQTVILDIAVSDPSAPRAAKIANAVAGSLSDVAQALSPKDAQLRPTVRSVIVKPAAVPATPSAPRKKLDVTAGLIAGLVLGVVLAFVRENVDTRVRGVAQMRALVDAPLLGQLAWDRRPADAPVVHYEPRSARAELYRQLRTNVQFLQVGGRSLAMVVSSSVPEEGKSTVAVNLALALAEISDRVLLVDADLRKPAVAERLGLEGSVGLTTVLVGRAEFDDIVQEWGPRRLAVLPSGAVPPNPTELLASDAMAALAQKLAGRYDVVIYDAAPLLPVTDALLLAKWADGVVLVTGDKRVRRAQLREARESLDRVGSRLLGVVATMLPTRSRTEPYGYGPDVTARAHQRGWWRRISRRRPRPRGTGAEESVLAPAVERPVRVPAGSPPTVPTAARAATTGEARSAVPVGELRGPTVRAAGGQRTRGAEELGGRAAQSRTNGA